MTDTLGNRISKILKAKGMSQKSLAYAIGITEATMSRYVNDERTPNAEVIVKIAKLLHTTTDDLLGLKQTNEEWLRSCTTEQLAEWTASVVQKAISIKENNGIVMLESAIWWVEWLKQPHTIKE